MNLPKQLSIPLVDIAAQQEEIQEKPNSQLKDAFRRTAFIGGKEVDMFEQQYAKFFGERHCIDAGNGTGTDAFEMALAAGRVLSGQEFIASVNTVIAAVEAVMRVGATAVLADVDEKHQLLDPKSVREATNQYQQLLRDMDGIRLSSSGPGNSDVCHLTAIRLAERERVTNVMRDASVLTAIQYPKPIYPHINGEQQQPLAQTLRNVVSGGLK